MLIILTMVFSSACLVGAVMFPPLSPAAMELNVPAEETVADVLPAQIFDCSLVRHGTKRRVCILLACNPTGMCSLIRVVTDSTLRSV